MMLKREIICMVLLLGLASTCTDSNCLTCLPHDQAFCITCASTHRVKDGVCVADCDPDNTGYTEFLDSNNNKRCINTFAIQCTAPCNTCVQGNPSTCLSCNAGFFLEDDSCVASCSGGLIEQEGLCKGNRRFDEFICAPGTYNDQTGSQASSACKNCESGKFCAGYKGTSNDGNCDAGYYCTGQAEYAKNHDDINNPSANTKGGRCTAGHSCPAGSTTQVACPAGKYCQRDGLASPSGNCQAGYYCIGGSATPVPDGSSPAIGLPCPQGHYCEEGQAAQQCPTGTYMPYTGASSLSECIPCDPGKYCGTSGALAVTGNCDAGYFCQGGASSAQPEGGICPKGYKCLAGSAAPDPCPLTEYQDQEGQSTCKACTAGNYCTEIAMLPCPAGYYCLANNNKQPCPRGTFRSSTGASLSNHCEACTVGFACPTHATVTPTIQCKAGYYCSGSATTDMPISGAEGGGLCSKGNYCPLGSSSEQPCPNGKYCPSQGLSAAAGDCQAGYYCSGGSMTSTPSGTGGNICSVGHYCPAGSENEKQCPEHTYINYTGADDSGDCAPCPAGLTCSGGIITNTACPAGSYCDHSGSQFACDAGYYCPTGSRDKIPCPPGQYQSQTSQSVCLPCPDGKYCEDLATITPSDCPDGYFCPEGTIARFNNPCPIGYRGLGTAKSTQGNGCQECDAGRYCATPGLTGTSLPLCDSGYFCNGGAKVPRPKDASDCITSSNCGLCPAGKFCTEGSSGGTVCPSGTYRPYPGAKSTDDCMPVPPGKYNSGTGLVNLPGSSTGTYGDCDAGYICTGGSNTPTPSVSTMGYSCSAGYFCPSGATHQQMCAVGYYQDQTQQGSCKQCTGGSYCPTQGLTTPITCEAGYYCQLGSIIPIPCGRGTYSSTTGNDGPQDCLACPAGKYCQTEGMATAVNECNQGHVCVSGSNTPTPQAEDYSSTNQVNGLCPRGHFCNPGSSIPDHCLAGTYNPSLGLGACVTCPPGYFCPSVQIDALTVSNECAAGYVCTAGSSTNNPTDGVKGKACPAGSFCEQGTAKQLACVDGKYQPNSGQSTCDPCPAGSLCQNSVQLSCVERKFCPQGSSYGQLCPNGRENELSVATDLSDGVQCAACPATKYCMGGLVIGFCQAGYLCTTLADSPTPNLPGQAEPCPVDNYCEIGEDVPNQCPSQKYTSGVGKMQESDCVDCPNGSYCDNSGSHTCPAGSYCPNGSSIFTPCPLYTYNDQTGQFHIGHCIPCPAGYYCNQLGVGNLDDVKCSPGYYCVEKAAYQIPCPAGKYRSAATLGDSYASCLSCPSGYYCPLATGNPIKCSDNEYCLGSSLPEPCPPGKHCTINNLGPTFPEQEMLIVDCPANFYCEEGNAGPQACAADKFCPTGSAYQQICDIDVNTGMCNSCPGGQWSSGMSECQECPAGYVCSGGTNTKYPTNSTAHNGYKCPVGHYCPAGSSIETPCPIGTYNPTIQGDSIASCLQCSGASYNFETGQSSCRSCGTAAYSSDDGTSCRCYGAYRAFQKHDASCTCKTGYSFETVDGSSSRDNCEPLPLPNNCNYNHIGVCGSNCATECNNPDATMTSEGVCACTAQPTGTPCDATCQDGFLNLQVSSSLQIKITHGSDVVSTPISQIPNTMGTPSCSSSFCKLVSIVGGAITSYEPSTKFVNLFKNTFSSYTSQVRSLASLPRQLSDITLFQSPVICVVPDTTIAFDTSAGNYPVYMKDSMLNTNQFFDYSEFEILGSRLSLASATIDTFFFTLTQEGVYMFEDSVTSASKTIISVTSGGCPEAYISELSDAALNEFNITSQDRGVKQIHYWPLGLLIAFFTCTLVSVSIVLGYLVKLDRFDVEVDRAALLDNGKASQDLRLLAIKRKLEEMIKQVREEKNKKHSDEWQRESVGRLQNFQDQVQLLIESLGLKEPEENIIEEEGSESSRLSDMISSMSGGAAGGMQYKVEEEVRSHESEESKKAIRDEEDQRVQGVEEPDVLRSRRVPEEHANFLNSDAARKTLEKRRVEFQAELRKRNLTGEEKRAQVEEFEQLMAQLQYSLEENEEKQKAHLLHELKKRRKNANKEQAKLGDVINREKGLKERHAKEIEALGQTLRQKEKEIDKAYDQELRNLKRDEIRKKNEALKKFKADFHKKIKQVADPSDVKALEAKHDSSYKEFLKAFEEEQAQQNRHLYERLAERKKKKMTHLQLTFENQMNEHAKRQDQEMLKEVLEEKIKLQAEHGLFREDEQLGGIDLEKEKELKKQQDMERELGLAELSNDQIADRNLVEIEFHTKEEELMREAEEGKLELPSEIALREKKEEFKQRLEASSSERERKELLKEQEAVLKEIQKQLERESKNQHSALELRKLQLKERKEAKLIEVQREHDREKREKELEVLQQQDAEREAEQLKQVDEIVKKALEEGKISQQELPLTLDSFLSQFATQQLKNLLNRQYIETSRAMGDVMAANLSERMQDTKALKDRFELKFKELEKADLPAKEFAKQTQKLQKEKEEELQNIEARYKIKQMDEEGRLKAELARKHGEQKLMLKEEQMKLKEDTMEKMIEAHAGSSPETKAFLRQLKRDLLRNAADDLREYRQKVEEERNKTMEEMKKKLFFDNDQEMEEFEVRFRQELKAEQDKVERKLQKEKDEIIRKRKKSFDERLKRMEGLAHSNIEVYVAEHDENMRRLDQALEAERQKQLASIHDKLKMRRMKQKKLKHITPSPTKPGLDISKSSPSTSFYKSKSGLDGKDLKKAVIDYKVKLKEWAERVKEEPPLFRDKSYDDLSVIDSSVGGLSHLDESRLRGASVYSVDRHPEDELMERVLKIERMAKLLLE